MPHVYHSDESDTDGDTYGIVQEIVWIDAFQAQNHRMNLPYSYFLWGVGVSLSKYINSQGCGLGHGTIRGLEEGCRPGRCKA